MKDIDGITFFFLMERYVLLVPLRPGYRRGFSELQHVRLFRSFECHVTLDNLFSTGLGWILPCAVGHRMVSCSVEGRCASVWGSESDHGKCFKTITFLLLADDNQYHLRSFSQTSLHRTLVQFRRATVMHFEAEWQSTQGRWRPRSIS